MPSNSETILANQTHPGDSTSETVTGDKYKGDGYYGRSDGLHTIQIDLNGFLGKIELQGTLAIDPTADDWFTVTLGSGQSIDTTGKIVSSSTTKLEYTTNETSSKTYNFTGNYVWVRTYVSNWTDGTVNNIKLNH
jgi:hypothetical protein